MAERYTIQSGVDVQPELAKLPPVYEPDSWTEIWTGIPDFSGHLLSQLDKIETVSEQHKTPVSVADRHEKASPDWERQLLKNGGGGRIRTSELRENRFTVCVL